jgi:hypothetical protein
MEDWLAVGGSLFESFMSWLEGPSLEIPTATATRKEQQHVGIQQELVHIGHSTAVYRVAHIPGRRPTSAEADARKCVFSVRFLRFALARLHRHRRRQLPQETLLHTGKQPHAATTSDGSSKTAAMLPTG